MLPSRSRAIEPSLGVSAKTSIEAPGGWSFSTPVVDVNSAKARLTNSGIGGSGNTEPSGPLQLRRSIRTFNSLRIRTDAHSNRRQ